MAKNPSANAGDVRGVGSIPGLGRSPGEGKGNAFQYSCLEIPTDRGAWRATVRGVTKSQTRLRRLSTHTVENRMEISQKTKNRTVTGGKGAGRKV